jgi:hypothetical protein
MFSFNSCNKCSHCTVTDDSGKIIKDYTEKCGTNEDINNYEKSATEDAKQYGGTLKCN